MSRAGANTASAPVVSAGTDIGVSEATVTADSTSLSFSYTGQDLTSFVAQVSTSKDFKGGRMMTIPKTAGRSVVLSRRHLRVIQRWLRAADARLYWRVVGFSADGRKIAVSRAGPLNVKDLPKVLDAPARHR